MSIFKFLFDVASWLVIGVIAIMALYVLSSNYNIFSGFRSYLVQSGSMEPGIMTGDIIVIHSQNQYVLNDVVTFKDNENRIVTHRIIENLKKSDRQEFATKGDANRSQDFDNITQNRIFGKVVFVVPKLGYLVAFAKSLPGLIILILIPASLFIIDELLKLKNAKQ